MRRHPKPESNESAPLGDVLLRGGVDFTVYGTPQPGGSKRAFFRPGMRVPSVVDANPAVIPWRGAVAAAAVSAWGNRPLLDGPLYLGVTFFRPRPQGHFRSGRNAGTLRLNAPTHPTTKPDALKLARAVEDALSGVLYRDDAQIVQETITKAWGEPARAEISLRRLVGPEAPQHADDLETT